MPASPSHSHSDRSASRRPSLAKATFVFPSTPTPAARRSLSSSSPPVNPWPIRTTSRSTSSPSNPWPLQTPSHSHMNSTPMDTIPQADPYTYRHFSAENFRLPDSPASPFNTWKTSHQPDMPQVRPEDLWRKSIGTFELDSPVSPEAYSAATTRNGSLASRPSTSRNGSLAHASTVSRQSSRGSEFEVSEPDVPAVPPAVMGLGTWDTHRKSLSSGT